MAIDRSQSATNSGSQLPGIPVYKNQLIKPFEAKTNVLTTTDGSGDKSCRGLSEIQVEEVNQKLNDMQLKTDDTEA